jgi:hypothetical protein
VKQTTHLHLVPRLRMVELYLHSPIRIHGTVLNYIIKFRGYLYLKCTCMHLQLRLIKFFYENNCNTYVRVYIYIYVYEEDLYVGFEVSTAVL